MIPTLTIISLIALALWLIVLKMDQRDERLNELRAELLDLRSDLWLLKRQMDRREDSPIEPPVDKNDPDWWKHADD